jgi:putative NADH-flavin reductase
MCLDTSEENMIITIFGAAGQTGKPLVERALALGYKVTAFIHKAGLPVKHNNLIIIQGDVTDPDAVDRAVRGAHAVINVLNTKANAKNKPVTRGTQNILAAMDKYGVRRLIMSSSGPTANDPGDIPNLRYDVVEGMVGFFVKSFLRTSYDDITDSVKIVKKTDIDWTIVRMPIPTNRPGTGRVNAGFVNKNTRLRISRANAATFMLNELLKCEYVRRTPVVFD